MTGHGVGARMSQALHYAAGMGPSCLEGRTVEQCEFQSIHSSLPQCQWITQLICLHRYRLCVYMCCVYHRDLKRQIINHHSSPFSRITETIWELQEVWYFLRAKISVSQQGRDPWLLEFSLKSVLQDQRVDEVRRPLWRLTSLIKENQGEQAVLNHIQSILNNSKGRHSASSLGHLSHCS